MTKYWRKSPVAKYIFYNKNKTLFTSTEIKSDKSANLLAFFKPHNCLILLYGGRPLSLPL